MRKRFLSFVAVAAMTLTAMAQWTAPAAPQLEGSDPEENGEFYLLNVGTGQFVHGANSWATEISLTTDGKAYVLILTESITADASVTGNKGTANTAAGDGWTMRLKEKYTFYGGNGRSGGYSFADCSTDYLYLWRNGSNGFVDLNNQNKGFVWNLTKLSNGDYHIQVIAEDPNFPNAADEYAAGVEAGSPVKFDAAETDANNEWRFVKPAAYSEGYAAQVAIFTARKALYDAYLSAVENGVDYADYTAVYNNANATIEELEAATTALKAAITRAVVLAKIAESSETNPIDITSVTIENPAFENGQKPWNITEGMGQNLQVQATGYPNDGNGNPAEGYDDFVIKNFIEAWRKGAALSDGVICQTVTGLPEGRYRIECDALAVWQSDPSIEQTGIYLFYNNGSYTLHSQEPISTGNGIPEHFTFDFDYDGNTTMTIGLMAENTNCNWMGMDNFQLFAIGECKDAPLWTALNALYANLSGYADEVKAESALTSALNDALSTAKGLIDVPSDKTKEAEYLAAYEAVEAARKAVVESEAAYKELKTFVDQLNSDQEKYTGELQTFVEGLYEQYSSAYENGEISASEIENAIAAYAGQVKQKTQELFNAAVAAGGTLETPIAITALFDDMAFAYGTTQTAFANGYPAENPVWMNGTSTGNFKTNYSTAEVWDARPFNIFRDFTDLPKGSYTIKTHAFYRVEANDANYPNYNDGGYDADAEYAYLFAGVNHTKLLNVAAIADPLLESLDAPYDCGDGNYLPNNQHSAYMIFSDSKYAALAKQCEVSATGNVLEDGGTLRAGIAGTDLLLADHWTIWYDFELYYNGIANLDTDIQSLIDQLTAAEDLSIPGNVTIKNNAIAAGNAAIGASFETQTAAIQVMQAALEELAKTQPLIDEVMALVAEYEGQITKLEISPTDNTIEQLLNDINDAISSEAIQSNAQLQGWIDALPGAWVKYVTSATEMADATADNPVELTPVILNADFSATVNRGVTPPHWVADGKMGGNQGYQDNNTYSNDEEGIAVSQFLEAWNSGNAALSDGRVYQTIAAALPEGFYRLTADGYATNQGNEDTLDGVYLFAAGAGANNNTSICQPNATPKTFTVDFAADGSGLTTIGVMAQSTECNWFAVDNFKLYYLGKTAPDAIESIDNGQWTMDNATIYGIDGRQSSQLRRGVNIVRSNGQVSKILVK